MANAPTVKEPSDGNAGTSIKAGAPDFVHVAQLLKGTHSTEKIQPSAIDGLSTEHASYKSPVRIASPVNINLGSASDPGAIDGITLANNNRILLKAQTAGAENGIYKCVNALIPNTWVRDSDFIDSSDVNSGLLVVSTEGTVGADKLWVLITDGNIVLGTTSLAFEQVNTSPSAAYGSMFQHNHTGDLMNATTKKWITAVVGKLDANGLITFVNDDTNGDYLLVGTGGAGDYQIIATCDVTNGGNNETIMEIHINGVDSTDLEDKEDTSSTKPRGMAAHGIHTLADADKITLHLESTTPADEVKVFDCHVTIQRIS